MVPATALMSEKTVFTTPPRRFTVVQIRLPSRLIVQVCGGELYCTITLTWVEVLESSGRRSGEILVLSAKAAVLAITSSPITAVRASALVHRLGAVLNIVIARLASPRPNRLWRATGYDRKTLA